MTQYFACQYIADTWQNSLLHITGPSHGPRVDIPNPAAIPFPPSAVHASAWTCRSPCSWNGSCVTHRHVRQLSKDVFDWQDIKHGVSRVQLVNDSRIIWFQGIYTKKAISQSRICNTTNIHNSHTYHAPGPGVYMFRGRTQMHTQTAWILCLSALKL